MIERLVRMHDRVGQIEDPVEAAKAEAQLLTLQRQIRSRLTTTPSFGGHVEGSLINLMA
jgi:hypothetical protein